MWRNENSKETRLPFSRRQTTREHTGDNTPFCLTPSDMKYQEDKFVCDLDLDLDFAIQT